MATIQLQEPMYRGHPGPVFFAAGFRPFFLSAGLLAAGLLPLWLAVWIGGLDLGLSFSPAVWHGHEMVFGFAGAAVGGFLLTAVPNWTNTLSVSGKPLMALYATWLAGRAAFLSAGLLPPVAVAILDMAYLPLLAAMMAGPLIGAGKMRNIAFLPILLGFWLANGLVHLDLVAGIGNAMTGIYLSIFLLLLMIVVVGGRVIPSFTQNWLMMQGRQVTMRPISWIEKGGAIGSLLVAGALVAVLPSSAAAGVALLAAGLIHLVRLSRWHGLKTVGNPILWVLHLGYLWLVAGLVLMGMSSFVDTLPQSAAVHALTAGSVGTMVLGIMSRAALGHSGRPLTVSGLVVAAYVLLSLGTVLRVLAPMVPAQVALTHAGGSLWAVAWVLFVVVYGPIVARPRADGRPG